MNNSTSAKVANQTIGDTDAHAHTSKQSCYVFMSSLHFFQDLFEMSRCFLGTYLSRILAWIPGGSYPAKGLVAFDFHQLPLT